MSKHAASKPSDTLLPAYFPAIAKEHVDACKECQAAKCHPMCAIGSMLVQECMEELLAAILLTNHKCSTRSKQLGDVRYFAA